MGLFNFFKKKTNKASNESDPDDFMAEMEAMMNKIKEEEGTEQDELPNHIGEFGFSRPHQKK